MVVRGVLQQPTFWWVQDMMCLVVKPNVAGHTNDGGDTQNGKGASEEFGPDHEALVAPGIEQTGAEFGNLSHRKDERDEQHLYGAPGETNFGGHEQPFHPYGALERE